MSNQQDGPRDATEIFDELIAQWKSGKPDKEAQQQERAYRRGYLQGWADALDTVFHQLLDKGIEQDQAYKVVARIENEVITPWRNTIEGDDKPRYNLDAFMEKDRD